jgi:hypothetical protein
MQPILRRFSIRLSRGWALLVLLVGGIVAAAFWIGPLRPLPAELQLVARTERGQYATSVRYDANRAAPGTTPGAAVRLPLVLGVRNVGVQPARPAALYLSVPWHFRVLDASGVPLPAQHTTGNPLTRLRVALEADWIQADSAVVPLLSADTLWLEPTLPSYYCIFLSEGVPDFVPAPAYDAELVARFQVFYSFSAASSARQTGVLEVEVDPELVRVEPAPVPPAYPVTYQEPEVPLPELGPLVKIGSRTEQCGDPDQSLTLQTVLWETASGGAFYVLYSGGQPRKYLFDLDRDGEIELEIWDQDGDGRFEARRQARFRAPAFLQPVRPALTDTVAAPPDSATLGAPPAAVVRPDSLRPDSARRDTLRRDTLRRDTL